MHLVHKHTVSVQTASIETGKEIQGEISELFEYDLYPKLDKLMDSYGFADQVLKFEKIHLKLKPIKKKDWKKELVQRTLSAFKEYLQSRVATKFTSANDGEETFNRLREIKDNEQEKAQQYPQKQDNDDEGISLCDKDLDVLKLFMTYLESGVLVQNVWVTTLNELFDNLQIEQEDNLPIARLLLRDGNSLDRWIGNVPEHIHIDFLKSFQEQKLPLQKEQYQEIWSTENNVQVLCRYVSCFNWLIFCIQKTNVHSKVQEEELRGYIESCKRSVQDQMQRVYTAIRKREAGLFQQSEQISNANRNIKEKEKHLDEKIPGTNSNDKTPKKKDEEPLYIANAGLVILHPFLSQFFEEVELMKKKEWLGEKAIERGVLLTQYLVTGQEKIFENELILNKQLCGWPIEKNIDTKFSISNWEKAICNDLLEDVIKHWKQLKNTAVKTLQEEFIQRQGRLVLEEDRNELIVEHKSIDILLDYLPWGIRLIKTPWMETELTCIWNT